MNADSRLPMRYMMMEWRCEKAEHENSSLKMEMTTLRVELAVSDARPCPKRG